MTKYVDDPDYHDRLAAPLRRLHLDAEQTAGGALIPRGRVAI
jgi:hypothetical protein